MNDSQSLTIRNSTAEFMVFIQQTKEDGIEVHYQNETIWMSRDEMARLFDTTRQNISLHLKNIFETNELNESSVVKYYLTTATDGKQHQTMLYSLDAIIAVGYRVNSRRGTQFRQWATRALKDFFIQGYVMDKKRIENSKFLGKDYFEQLLTKIREIRISERHFYQKITDIYATSIDYNKDATTTKEFFNTVQNKMHYAIHNHTAPELIKERADSSKPNMGLTNWERKPNGKIHKYDVTIARNYLTEDELSSLGRIVNAYLDFAEAQAMKKIPMTMEDWEKHIIDFLKVWDMDILQETDKTTAELAKIHAETEYEKYRIIQDGLYRSDFDKQLNKLEVLEGKLAKRDGGNDD